MKSNVWGWFVGSCNKAGCTHVYSMAVCCLTVRGTINSRRCLPPDNHSSRLLFKHINGLNYVQRLNFYNVFSPSNTKILQNDFPITLLHRSTGSKAYIWCCYNRWIFVPWLVESSPLVKVASSSSTSSLSSPSTTSADIVRISWTEGPAIWTNTVLLGG